MTSDTEKNSPFLAIAIIVTVISLIAAVVWVTVIKPRQALPVAIANTYIPEGRPVVGIQLKDHNNQPFSEDQFKGKWSFLFFGFTHCPDVCPTTLLVMKSVWAKLPESAKQSPEPQLVFVSVDPDRDTPAILKNYVQYYHPDFIAITGKHNFIDILTVQVGALYGYEDGENENDYTVNHSAQIVLIDPQGYFRGVFTSPHQVNEIVKTFTAIRDYHPG